MKSSVGFMTPEEMQKWRDDALVAQWYMLQYKMGTITTREMREEYGRCELCGWKLEEKHEHQD